jgi:hypothetical protein
MLRLGTAAAGDWVAVAHHPDPSSLLPGLETPNCLGDLRLIERLAREGVAPLLRLGANADEGVTDPSSPTLNALHPRSPQDQHREDLGSHPAGVEQQAKIPGVAPGILDGPVLPTGPSIEADFEDPGGIHPELVAGPLRFDGYCALAPD